MHGETVVTSKPEPEEQLDVAVNYLSMLAAALHFVAAAVAFAVLVVAVAANKTCISTDTNASPTFVAPSLRPNATPSGPIFLALRRTSDRRSGAPFLHAITAWMSPHIKATLNSWHAVIVRAAFSAPCLNTALFASGTHAEMQARPRLTAATQRRGGGASPSPLSSDGTEPYAWLLSFAVRASMRASIFVAAFVSDGSRARVLGDDFLRKLGYH